MKIIKTFNLILACGLLLMSIGLAFGQTQGKRIPTEKQLNINLIVPTKQTWIMGTAISPDGKLLASLDRFGILKIWDVETAGELKILKSSHQSGNVIGDIAFSSTNRFLTILEFITNDDPNIKIQSRVTIWDLEHDEEFQPNDIPNSFITNVISSASGNYIAASHVFPDESNSPRIVLQNLENPADSMEIISEIPIFYLNFSPDGKKLYGCGAEGDVFIWSLQEGKSQQITEGSETTVSRFALSSDGKSFGVVSNGGGVTIYNALNGEVISHTQILKRDAEFFTTGGILSPKFNADLSRLVSILEMSYANKLNDNFLTQIKEGVATRVWNTTTGSEILNLKEKNLAIESNFALNSDGSLAAHGYFNGSIKLIDTSSGATVKTFAGSTVSSIGTKLGSDNKIFSLHADLQKIFALYAVKNLSNNPNLEKEFGKYLLGELSITIWNLEKRKVSNVLDLSAQNVLSANTPKKGEIGLVAYRENERTIILYQIAKEDFEKKDKEIFRTFSIRQGTFSDTLNSSSLNDANTRLATSIDDHTIKIWDVASGKELRILKGHSQSVSYITFSPDGNSLTSISEDGIILLWDVNSGKLLGKFLTPDRSVKQVVYSPDGRFLTNLKGGNHIYLWNIGSRDLVKVFDTKQALIEDVKFSPDGLKLAVSGKSEKIVEFALWDLETGKNLFEKEMPNDFIDAPVFDFSPDGKTLVSQNPSFHSTIFINTKTGEITGEMKNDLYSYFSLDYSEDGKMLIGSCYDGRIVIYNVKSLSEIISLFNLGENGWVVLSPDGRFDASEGAMKLMHYAYGLEIINLEQLKEAYYEPGLLQKLLGYSKEPLRPIVPLKDVKLYPEVISQAVEPNTTKLTIKLKNRGGGIGRVQVFVGNELGNKLVVEDARDGKFKANPNVAEATLTVDLQGANYLKGKPNKITVVTSNYLREIGKGNIQSRGAEIVWTPPGKEEYSLPTLYAIVGGVSDYAGEQLDLRFAAKDAEDFSGALSLGAKKLFCDKTNPNCLDKVNITTLSTSGKEGTILPTKENFLKAFREIAAKAKPEDILVIYLAGHGVSFGAGTDSYFYLTQEARATSREDLAKVLTTSAISSEELKDWLTPDNQNQNDIFVKAMKQVVILDTCASGNAAGQLALTAKRDLSGDQIRAVEFLKDKTGTFVLMASTADAPSYEASQFGQGLLTYSLLQAMKGAALDRGEYVDVQKLFGYAQTEVPRLAANIGGVQRPIVSAPLGKTFVIGQMTEPEKQKVPLAAVKPLMLRPLLTNPETGDDDLKLIPALRKLLDAESSYEVAQRSGKGEPTLIYIDDDSFPGAVRVTGTYTVEGEKVRVKAFLRRDGKTIAPPMEIAADKDKILSELLTKIRGQLTQISK